MILPGAGQRIGPRPELRFGHIPGNARTVEGLQRKLGPLSFWAMADRRGAERDCQSEPAGVEMRADKTREAAMRLEGGCYCGELR